MQGCRGCWLGLAFMGGENGGPMTFWSVCRTPNVRFGVLPQSELV
jgi:hypothetical protein